MNSINYQIYIQQQIEQLVHLTQIHQYPSNSNNSFFNNKNMNVHSHYPPKKSIIILYTYVSNQIQQPQSDSITLNVLADIKNGNTRKKLQVNTE